METVETRFDFKRLVDLLGFRDLHQSFARICRCWFFDHWLVKLVFMCRRCRMKIMFRYLGTTRSHTIKYCDLLYSILIYLLYINLQLADWRAFEIVFRMPHQKLPGTNLYELGLILSSGLKRSREK